MSNTENTNSKKTPGYVAFAKALIERFADAKIPLVPVADPTAKDGLRGPEGWVCFQVAGTDDKVYCRRTAGGAPTAVETTVPYADIPADLVAEDMRGRNGKIEARVKPDVDLIAAGLFPVLAERVRSGQRLRAAKLPERAARTQQ